MCGIVAYIGTSTASPLLMEGLKRLEYRGYDSAGVAVLDTDGARQLPEDLGNALQELQAVLQEKQCRNCHAIGGRGGKRGPDLTDVASRLTYDELVRQVLQGGGNMPAYGKNLTPPQVTALTAFLLTMHPDWEHEPDAIESDTPRPTTDPDPPVDF